MAKKKKKKALINKAIYLLNGKILWSVNLMTSQIQCNLIKISLLLGEHMVTWYKNIYPCILLKISQVGCKIHEKKFHKSSQGNIEREYYVNF